jgi:hypothetical protein
VGTRYIATANWGSGNAVNDIMALASTGPDVWTASAPTENDAVFATIPSTAYVFNSAWVQFNSGATYTFSTGLTNNANTITLAVDGVDTTNIKNGAVTAAKLNTMGASTGQVLAYNGSTWAPALTTNGTVTNVTASAPLSSSGGSTPVISLTGAIPVANGGTGSTTQAGALNAILPAQASNSGGIFTTDGTNASWQVRSPVVGTLPASPSNITGTGTKYTGASITLPPGKWAVNVAFQMTVDNCSYTLRTVFSTSSSSLVHVVSPEVLGADQITAYHPSGVYSPLTGTLLINNTSGAAKTYYFWVSGVVNVNGTLGITGFGRASWTENQILALPVL